MGARVHPCGDHTVAHKGVPDDVVLIAGSCGHSHVIASVVQVVHNQAGVLSDPACTPHSTALGPAAEYS
jgi:hypothetical protein